MDGEENFIYNCNDPITDTFLNRSREQRTERAKFTFSARIRSRRVSSLSELSPQRKPSSALGFRDNGAVILPSEAWEAQF